MVSISSPKNSMRAWGLICEASTHPECRRGARTGPAPARYRPAGSPGPPRRASAHRAKRLADLQQRVALMNSRRGRVRVISARTVATSTGGARFWQARHMIRGQHGQRLQAVAAGERAPGGLLVKQRVGLGEERRGAPAPRTTAHPAGSAPGQPGRSAAGSGGSDLRAGQPAPAGAPNAAAPARAAASRPRSASRRW
jgi:hypothetical protein